MSLDSLKAVPDYPNLAGGACKQRHDCGFLGKCAQRFMCNATQFCGQLFSCWIAGAYDAKYHQFSAYIRHMSGQRSKHQFGHFGPFRCENIFVCCFFFSLNHLRLRIRICLVITSLFLFLSMSLLCVPLCLVVFSLSLSFDFNGFSPFKLEWYVPYVKFRNYLL